MKIVRRWLLHFLFCKKNAEVEVICEKTQKTRSQNMSPHQSTITLKIGLIFTKNHLFCLLLSFVRYISAIALKSYPNCSAQLRVFPRLKVCCNTTGFDVRDPPNGHSMSKI